MHRNPGAGRRRHDLHGWARRARHQEASCPDGTEAQEIHDPHGEDGTMTHNRIVSQDEWLAARRRHLAKEKELTRLRDELSRQRRELPWVRVERPYVFDTAGGKRTLPELFAGRSQLIVYHFMLGPGWEEGCKSCSFLADHIDGSVVHLAHRDVTLLAVSRAPLHEIQAFKRRMGWRFPWASSNGSDFNFDYHVSFTED